MNDQRGPQQNNNRRGYIPAACVRFIEKLQRKTQESDSDTNKNDTYGRGIYFATWIIAAAGLLTFGAAAIQACIFFKQLNVMQGQLDVMEADQRPWIKISDVKVLSPLKFGPLGDANINLQISGENVGKSVAYNVWPTPELYVFADGKPSHRVPNGKDETCNPEKVPKSTLNVMGDNLFPNKTIPIDMTYIVSIPQAEIAAADSIKIANGAILFFVQVCIDYRVAEKRYTTGAAFALMEDGSGTISIVPGKDKAVPVYLQRVPSNTFAH